MPLVIRNAAVPAATFGNGAFSVLLIVGMVCLILASMAVEFVSGLYGASPEQHVEQLNQWAQTAGLAEAGGAA